MLLVDLEKEGGVRLCCLGVQGLADASHVEVDNLRRYFRTSSPNIAVEESSPPKLLS